MPYFVTRCIQPFSAVFYRFLPFSTLFNSFPLFQRGIRQRGSHLQYHNAINGRQTTVPMHKGRDIAPGLLRQIAKDAGLTVDDFRVLR